MKLQNVMIRALVVGITLLAPVCWSMGPMISGMPEFFPGEPSGGISEFHPQPFDVMTMMVGQGKNWPGEEAPGLNGILQPDGDEEDEWAFWGLEKTGAVNTGGGLLPDPEPTIWEKTRKAVDEFLAYFRPQEIPRKRHRQRS